MRRLLGAAALALSLGCLDGGTGTDVPIWLPSSYRLEAVDGAALPVTLTTLDGQSHTIVGDTLQLQTTFTFYNQWDVTDASGTRSVAEVGPFTTSREGRIVISAAGRMLSGTGTPSIPVAGVASVIEFRTTGAATYGAHRYRFVRTAP